MSKQNKVRKYFNFSLSLKKLNHPCYLREKKVSLITQRSGREFDFSIKMSNCRKSNKYENNGS